MIPSPREINRASCISVVPLVQHVPVLPPSAASIWLNLAPTSFPYPRLLSSRATTVTEQERTKQIFRCQTLPSIEQEAQRIHILRVVNKHSKRNILTTKNNTTEARSHFLLQRASATGDIRPVRTYKHCKKRKTLALISPELAQGGEAKMHR